jgi:hypothetical protein
MSRLYSVTLLGLLVGGATDPMKGECECIDLADVKQEFLGVLHYNNLPAQDRGPSRKKRRYSAFIQ